jgi:catechol 2,3-dioxygenase-like lactoylglutathione lyase family enzyme|tara:strand:- start:160 stop:936 length:777 start_codon:yes stop_codon:yes gene_type:complete
LEHYSSKIEVIVGGVKDAFRVLEYQKYQGSLTMNKVEGLHHLAICTGDMKAQIDFFTDKLGMELQALYWMHGVENTCHAFLRLNDESSIAFVHNPDISKIESNLGSTHSGNAGSNSAPGTMQHLALKVQSNNELLAMRDRLRSKGVPALGPIEHGMCRSIYFAGLENMTLEFSFSPVPIDNRLWVDPEVVQLLGITGDELASYRNPEPYDDQSGGVPQPGIEAPGPHLTYPPEIYPHVLALKDEDILYSVEHEPPVKI